MKHSLCTTPMLTLSDLQPFEIDIDAFDYALGVFLTQHAHPVEYNNNNNNNNNNNLFLRSQSSQHTKLVYETPLFVGQGTPICPMI
jgi:hypothetical protein